MASHAAAPGNAPQSHYVQCAGREVHYTEWGAHHSRTVVAWHGLAWHGKSYCTFLRGYRIFFIVISLSVQNPAS